jgi:hypothetical protein
VRVEGGRKVARKVPSTTYHCVFEELAALQELVSLGRHTRTLLAVHLHDGVVCLLDENVVSPRGLGPDGGRSVQRHRGGQRWGKVERRMSEVSGKGYEMESGRWCEGCRRGVRRSGSAVVREGVRVTRVSGVSEWEMERKREDWQGTQSPSSRCG